MKPVIAGTLLLAVAACAAPNANIPKTAPATVAVKGVETAQGGFVGASDHVTTGSASVVRQADGSWVVVLDESFSLDGAPDPVVGFGRDGYQAESKLGALQALRGQQVYAVPASLDVGDYDQVYIWCEQFSVPLGVAALELS